MTIRFNPRMKPRARRSVVYDPARKVFERKVLEEDVVKEIMARLGYAGFKVFRERERRPISMNGKVKHFGAQASDGGHPDLHGWVPIGKTNRIGHVFPIPFYIEVKRPGGRRRPKQIVFIEEAKADNVIAFFAEKWEDVTGEFAKQGIFL